MRSSRSGVAAVAKEKAKKKPAKGESLGALLGRLDPLVASHSDAKLRAPAKAADLAKLSKTFFGGAPLPADLDAWFRWHDGQQEASGTVSPDDNRTLLSIDGALDAWQFLSDPEEEIPQPWKKSWLPLFANGAGDYVVFETEGKKAGALIGYWHTDTDRDVEHASLGAWATTVEKALLALAKPKKKGKKDKIRLELGDASWTKVAKPRADAAAKKPVGTVYYWKQLLFGQPQPWCIAWVKAAPNIWLKGMGRPGPAEAIADLQGTIDKRRPPADWEWLKDDRSVVIEALASHGVTADGSAPHVGLHEGAITIHGTEVPRREGY